MCLASTQFDTKITFWVLYLKQMASDWNIRRFNTSLLYVDIHANVFPIIINHVQYANIIDVFMTSKRKNKKAWEVFAIIRLNHVQYADIFDIFLTSKKSKPWTAFPTMIASTTSVSHFR